MIDIRQPIGWLFALLGMLLLIQGLGSATAAASRSVGFNVDACWGAVMLVFAATMLALAWRQRRRAGTQG